MALERTGQVARAVAVYQDAINRGLSTDIMNARLGKLYLRLHQPDKAVDAMNRADQINPTDGGNLRALGYTQLQLGRVAEAEKVFKAIIIQNDHYSAAYNGLGLMAIKHGDREAACRDFEKAFELDPSDLEPLLNLGVFCETAGDKSMALYYYQESLNKASPKDYGDLIPKVRSAVQELKSGA
jgi:Flp pilus assembly protein TadD